MARAIEELEREISKLSSADKERLIEFLITEIEPPAADLRELIRQFSEAVNGMNETLAVTLEHLEGLDERLEQGAREAREEVLRSDYRWPFPSRPAELN